MKEKLLSKMNFHVEHTDIKEYVYPINRNEIYLKLKHSGIKSSKIVLVHWNYFEPNEIFEKKLESYEVNNNSNHFFTRIQKKDTIKYFRYYFKIIHEGDIYYFSHEGLTSNKPVHVFVFTDVNEEDIFITPKWAEGKIGYQIFVDRFYKESSNYRNQISNWSEEPTRKNFFGGTLSGIALKMSYLKSIGIKIIYLTPIFESYSNHKYDTTNYFVIDPDFGTKKDLKYLVLIAHKHKIKIVDRTSVV